MWGRWRFWKAVDVIPRLPDHYQRYLFELQNKPPQPVHYVPEPYEFRKNPSTGAIERVESRPIPVIFPPECQDGMWGGEGIIKGFRKKHDKARRFPHYWTPVLKKSIFYSEILDKHMEITITDRTQELVDKAFGFDNYVLQTDPVDLRSQLAMDLRRQMLLTLVRGELYPDNPKKREEVYNKYKKFIIPEEKAEWVGLTLKEAIKKQLAIEEKQNSLVPFKTKFRKELVEKLKEAAVEKDDEQSADKAKNQSSWASRLNPFQSS